MGVSMAAVAANSRHEGAKARREAAPAHLYMSRGATAVPWAAVLALRTVSAVPSGSCVARSRVLTILSFFYPFWATGVPTAMIAANQPTKPDTAEPATGAPGPATAACGDRRSDSS